MEITKETLQERLKDVEARFNAAKTKKEQASVSLEDAENECLRVQGEYRAIQGLITQAESAESTEGKNEVKNGRK